MSTTPMSLEALQAELKLARQDLMRKDQLLKEKDEHLETSKVAIAAMQTELDNIVQNHAKALKHLAMKAKTLVNKKESEVVALKECIEAKEEKLMQLTNLFSYECVRAEWHPIIPANRDVTNFERRLDSLIDGVTRAIVRFDRACGKSTKARHNYFNNKNNKNNKNNNNYDNNNIQTNSMKSIKSMKSMNSVNNTNSLKSKNKVNVNGGARVLQSNSNRNSNLHSKRLKLESKECESIYNEFESESRSQSNSINVKNDKISAPMRHKLNLVDDMDDMHDMDDLDDLDDLIDIDEGSEYDLVLGCNQDKYTYGKYGEVIDWNETRSNV